MSTHTSLLCFAFNSWSFWSCLGFTPPCPHPNPHPPSQWCVLRPLRSSKHKSQRHWSFTPCSRTALPLPSNQELRLWDMYPDRRDESQSALRTGGMWCGS